MHMIVLFSKLFIIINMVHQYHFIYYLFIIAAIFEASSAASSINVVSFGAKPDGKFDSTRSFLSAWFSACTSREPATIYVPQGNFLVKQVTFQGPCKNKVEFRIDGTIVAPSDYLSLGDS